MWKHTAPLSSSGGECLQACVLDGVVTNYSHPICVKSRCVFGTNYPLGINLSIRWLRFCALKDNDLLQLRKGQYLNAQPSVDIPDRACSCVSQTATTMWTSLSVLSFLSFLSFYGCKCAPGFVCPRICRCFSNTIRCNNVTEGSAVMMGHRDKRL